MSLSIESVEAVASIILRPRLITSRWVNSLNLTALASFFGSALYTPSTPFFAIKIASASISAARRAAVVSVEKYGEPIPAPKITIRPFSR